MLTERLRRFGFSRETNETVRPIIQAVEDGQVEIGIRMIAELALDVCDKVEKGFLSPKEGDQFFLLIDLYIDESCGEIELGENCKNLILEGNILHDYGTEFGPDLTTMRTLARRILQENRAPGSHAQ